MRLPPKRQLVRLSYLNYLYLLLILVCSPASGKDAFVTATIGEPTNLIPFLATDTASRQISNLIFNGLVKYDKNLTLVGDLAEHYDISDGGKRITFHLRRGVRWQDGHPFTAADVLFTHSLLVNPEIPTPYGADFQKVTSIRAPDNHTVEVTYAEPFVPALASWSMGIVPMHILGDQNILTTEFSRKPVGTGPYRLKSWKSSERIELEANGDYFEGKPFIDRYVMRIIPDQTTIFLETQTGNLDYASLTPLQYSRLTDTRFFDRHYRKLRYPSLGYTYLAYNLNHPVLKDSRIRKIIGSAVQKDELVRVVLMGLGRVSTGPFLPTSWANNPEVTTESAKPAQIRQRLNELGWRDTDADGIADQDGRPLEFTVLTNQGNETRKMAAEIIQRQLRQAGIDMKIRVVEWSTLIHHFIDKGNFDAILLGWNLSPDPDVYDIFHSSRIGPGLFNFVNYRNVEVDRLLEAGRVEFDQEKRREIYHKLQRILVSDEPYTFLFVPDALPAVHKRFRGIEVTPLGIGLNFIRWTVDDAEVKYA